MNTMAVSLGTKKQNKTQKKVFHENGKCAYPNVRLEFGPWVLFQHLFSQVTVLPLKINEMTQSSIIKYFRTAQICSNFGAAFSESKIGVGMG